MANITNNYADGSCVFEAGSSQNGDVNIFGDIYHEASLADRRNDAAGRKSEASPIHLSSQKGTKIDFIRMMNAWYECGKVQDANGNRLSKKEYFEWLGKSFNCPELSRYDKDLSTSMSSGVAEPNQTRIFDDLKAKHQAIFDSK